MTAPWKAVVALLLQFVTISTCIPSPVVTPEPKQLQPQIWTVLDFLNAQDDRVYNYNFAHLINAQKKTQEISALEVEVQVECIDKDRCNENTLICKAYVEYFPETDTFQTLPDVECNPKDERSTKEVQQAVTEEIPRPTKSQQHCTGCLFELNKDAEGSQDLIDAALDHINFDRQRRHSLINVLKLERQIVGGVKYYLLLEVAPTVCSININKLELCPIDEGAKSEICQIQYYQRPWISKDKHIVSNNCTVTQEYIRSQKSNDLDNEIETNNDFKKVEVEEITDKGPNFEKMAESGKLFDDLISQIIPTEPVIQKTTNVAHVEATKSAIDNSQMGIEDRPVTPTHVTYNRLVDFLTQFFYNLNVYENRAPIDATNAEEGRFRMKREVNTVDPLKKSKHDSSSEESSEEKQKTLKHKASSEESSEEKQTKREKRELSSDSSESSEETHKQTPKVKRDIFDSSSEESDETNDPLHVIENEETLVRDKRETGDKKEYKKEGKKASEKDKKKGDEKKKIENANEDSSSSTSEDDGKNKKDDDSSSSSSSSEETDKKHTTKKGKKDVEDSSSSSSSSEEEENKKVIKKKSKKDEDSSSSSSSSSDDDSDDNKSKKKSNKVGDDSSSSSSSSSDDNDNKKNNKKSNKVDDDSSSSSSSSSDDDDNKKNNKKSNKVDDDSSSSSSSSSDDDDNKKNNKKSNKVDDDSSSSSSSSDDDDNKKSNKVDDDSSSSSSSSSDDDDNKKNNKKSNKVDDSSSSSSSSSSDDSSDDKVSNKKSNNDNDDSSSSSSSSDDKEYKNNINIKININKDDSSSSSSSSDDDEDKKKCNCENDKHQGKNDDSSSSSDSSDDDKHKKNKQVDSSSSSSSSSSSDDDNNNNKDTKKSNTKKQNDDSSSSSSSSSDDEPKKRKKRDLHDFYKPDSDEKHLVKKISNFAAASLNNEGHKNDVLEILKVKKIELEGAVYHISLRIGESHCSGFESCLIDEEKLCKFQIHITKDEKVIKVLKSHCHKIERFSDKNRTVNRSKRQIPGAPFPASNDDTVKTLVKDTLLKLDSQSSHANKYKVRKIIEATTQIVSGVRYKITAELVYSDCNKNDAKDSDLCNEHEKPEPKVCKFDIWDQPWLPEGRRTSVTCGTNKYSFRSRRSIISDEDRAVMLPKIQIPGAPVPASNDDSVKILVKETLLKLDSESSHANKYKVRKIIEATKQIVSGFSYKITAELVYSDCDKNDAKDSDLCNEHEKPEPKVCKFDIWDQPWLPEGRKTSVTCGTNKYSFRSRRSIISDEDRSKRHALGAPFQVSNDDTVKTLVKETLLKLDSQSSHENKYKVRKIIEATKQIVSGLRYKITAELVYSDCNKNDAKDSDLCNEHEKPEPKVCKFDIWDQPWLPEGRKTSVSCGTNKYSFRSRRSIVSDKEEAVFKKFNEFIKSNNKYYGSDYMKRYWIFKENMQKIETLNREELGTAKYGITKFADLDEKEFEKHYLGLRSELRNENEIAYKQAQIPDVDLPESFDWREKGAVAEVKDQGQCGSCWAFSVTGNVEGQYFLKHGKLLEFSEQELVDCDNSDEGCNGGFMDNAYRAIEKLGGLELENDYPYDAKDEKCHFNKSLAVAKLSGAVNISHDESDMAKWLITNGPMSIGINANAMQFYMGGVSHPMKFLCSPSSLNHGVLIVGYGVHNYPMFNKSLPYWIVKNSWGPKWGEQGYYRVFRGDGSCGVNQMVSSAIVE